MIQEIPQLFINGIVVGSIVALAALGLSLIFAIQRFVNVAHAEFMTVGAYGTYLLATIGTGFYFAALGGVILSIVVAIFVYIIVFRRMRGKPSVSLVVASIGVGLCLRFTIALIWGSKIRRYPFPVSSGIDLGLVRMTPEELIIIAISLIEMLGLYLLLKKTRLGIEMRAVADVPELARVSGISSNRVIFWTWVFAAAFAATGGIGVGAYSFLTPLLGWQLLLVAFAASVLGGIGSPQGAVLGGFIMGIAQEISTIVIPVNYKPAVAFAALIVILLVRPSGIIGSASRI